MITYQIDKYSHQKLVAEIRELSPILAEIAPTLQSLQEILSQHGSTISTPTINNYRAELEETVAQAIAMTKAITDDTHKLASVSEQASKHLSAIEEHFGAILRGSQKETAEAVAQEA